MDLGTLFDLCLSKFANQEKTSSEKSAGEASFIHGYKNQRCAERSHTECSRCHTFKSPFSPSPVSLKLSLAFTVQQNRAEHKKCVFDSRNKDFKVLFHSPEELLNTITVLICDNMVKYEEKVFVNCWHNKINFPSLNFFSCLLWALMQWHWLALLKCQLAFLILNFSLNVISNCYCQTRECNLVFLKENPFLISSPVLPPFGEGWMLNTACVLHFQEEWNSLKYPEVKHSCFIVYSAGSLKHIFQEL